jgi:uncharacterized protein YjbI with pentapeptide repeats
MRTKNLTGFPFGAKVTSRKPPQREMTLIVRGTFVLQPGQPLVPAGGSENPLAQGFMTAEVFHEGDDARAGECIYPGDFADFKLHTDLLLRGTCHAPEGRPVTECPVRFSVGDWSKSLRVVGRRVWSDAYGGAAKSAPLPFTKMPINWAHAFGGPGYAQNPAGKGVGTAELPNLEHPGDPVRAREDRLKPVSFGPINPAWPQRAPKVGKEYGKAYREQRAPFYAEDFDWTYFNAAPGDQQLSGYLRGDEEIGFVNLHPDAPIWSTRLPSLRVRAFVIDVEERFREVKLHLDTLFADLDKGTLVLTWRGLDKVKEDDLIDVRTVLVVAEPLEGPNETEAHYRAMLDAYERDPLGLAAYTPKGMPDPAEAQKKVDAMLAAAAASKGAADGTQAAGALLQLFSGPGRETMGGDVGKMMAAAGDGTKEHFGLGAALAGAAATGAANDSPGPRAAPGPLVMPPAGPLPTSFSDPRARAAVRAMPGQVAEARKTTEAQGVPAEHLAALDSVGENPHLAALSAEPAGGAPEPGPGRSLPGVDWSERDLSGVDLTDADLTGARLAGANLRGAKLTGAKLHGAVLFEAILEDADLSSADLTLANLTGARAAGVNLSGALLVKTFFDKADLARADLRRATGESILFQTASLPGAKFGGARFEQAHFQGSTLDGADFGGATLTRSLFHGASAKGADFTRAVLIKTSFIDSDLEGARFIEARGDRAVFLRTRMSGADFSYALMPGSHFTESRGTKVRFFAANLREGRFYRSSLDRADFVKANLFSADFCKAVLTGARFTDANLYDAKFTGASGAGCDFTGANLKRSTLEKA